MIRKVITETILSNINLPTKFREVYKKVVLNPNERAKVEASLPKLNEDYIDKILLEVNKDQQKSDIEKFDELESFKQQLPIMTKMNLKTFMLKIMKNDPNKDLNTIFSEAVNSLIVEMFKQNTQIGSYLNLISYDYKKEIYKYVYSQAKETYLDDYYIFTDYHNLAKSGLL